MGDYNSLKFPQRTQDKVILYLFNSIMQQPRAHAENSTTNYMFGDIRSYCTTADHLMININHFGNAHGTKVFQILANRTTDTTI